MSKYKTKPFEIEAVLFDGNNWQELDRFCGDRRVDAGWLVPNFAPAGTYRNWEEDPSIFAEVFDKLHSTWMGVKVGQYIIKGSQGEFYPCDPKVFHSKYELVD
jgi:hypothetical protein